MSTVLLTALVVWLVLSALVTVACALVARGGLHEDQRHGRLDADLSRVLTEAQDQREPVVPRPRGGRG